MKDIYFMNKNTGELLPSSQAIKEFYKEHNILDDWAEDWEETNIEVDDSEIDPPDFTNIF